MLAKWLNDPHGKPPYNPTTGTLSWTTFRQNLFGYAYYQHGAVSCRAGKRCHSLHTAACTRQPPHGSRHTHAAILHFAARTSCHPPQSCSSQPAY